MKIYENVKIACKSAGLSIASLETSLGFSRSSICKWDSSMPGVDKVKAVAAKLGCTVDSLLVDTETSSKKKD